MSDAASLLSALGIAAFERSGDGAFAPLGAPPAWLDRLVADGTFPFVGHILEEASQFWADRTDGRRDWGPCAEVDESGTEFHYSVSALTVGDGQYLVFRLDPGGDQLREVPADPGQALAAGQDLRSEAAVAGAQQTLRQTAADIQALVAELPTISTAPARLEHWKAVSWKCDELVRGIDDLIDALSPAAGPPPQP